MFHERIKKSEIAINALIKYLNFKKMDYAFSGYEKLNSSQEFNNKIINLNNNCKTGKLIRFYPDISAISEDNYGYLIEVKNSIFIEKNSYETCKHLSDSGYSVFLVLYLNDELLITNIKNIKFIEITFADCPITDGIWQEPRKLDKLAYCEWKKKHKYASGTSFGKIDIENSNFKRLISNTASVHKIKVIDDKKIGEQMALF